MTRNEIFAVLKDNIHAIVEAAKTSEITEAQSLIYDLGADSLEAVEVVSRTMKQLNIRVPRTEIANAENISDVLDMLQKAANQNA